MAEKIRKLANSEVEVLARIVAECMTGSQKNEIFRECGVRDTSNESTKRKKNPLHFFNETRNRRIVKCFS